MSKPLNVPDAKTPSSLSAAGTKYQVSKILASTSSLYLLTQMRGQLTFTLQNGSGEPVQGVYVSLTSPPKARCDAANPTSDSAGNVIIYCNSTSEGSGQLTVSAGQVNAEAQVSIGNTYAQIQTSGSTMTLNYGFAGLKKIVVTDGAKKLLCIYPATNQPGTTQVKLSKGTQKIKVSIGGIQFAFKMIQVSK